MQVVIRTSLIMCSIVTVLTNQFVFNTGNDYEGYQPLWFERKVDSFTGELICVYKGGYWESKEKQDWSICPDIFWLRTKKSYKSHHLKLGTQSASQTRIWQRSGKDGKGQLPMTKSWGENQNTKHLSGRVKNWKNCGAAIRNPKNIFSKDKEFFVLL